MILKQPCDHSLLSYMYNVQDQRLRAIADKITNIQQSMTVSNSFVIDNSLILVISDTSTVRVQWSLVFKMMKQCHTFTLAFLTTCLHVLQISLEVISSGFNVKFTTQTTIVACFYSLGQLISFLILR